MHLDVDAFGIPLTVVVARANVHDSQVSIPMEKKTSAVVDRLYSLMDASYDAKEIRSIIEATGGIALIDTNKRRGDAREPMDPAAKRRFAIRTTVERANSHLKDRLLPGKILTKGYEKANFTIMSGVVCLAAVKILQLLDLTVIRRSGVGWIGASSCRRKSRKATSIEVAPRQTRAQHSVSSESFVVSTIRRVV